MKISAGILVLVHFCGQTDRVYKSSFGFDETRYATPDQRLCE